LAVRRRLTFGVDIRQGFLRNNESRLLLTNPLEYTFIKVRNMNQDNPPKNIKSQNNPRRCRVIPRHANYAGSPSTRALYALRYMLKVSSVGTPPVSNHPCCFKILRDAEMCLFLCRVPVYQILPCRPFAVQSRSSALHVEDPNCQHYVTDRMRRTQ
jgi:hypothetical protein